MLRVRDVLKLPYWVCPSAPIPEVSCECVSWFSLLLVSMRWFTVCVLECTRLGAKIGHLRRPICHDAPSTWHTRQCRGSCGGRARACTLHFWCLCWDRSPDRAHSTTPLHSCPPRAHSHRPSSATNATCATKVPKTTLLDAHATSVSWVLRVTLRAC